MTGWEGAGNGVASGADLVSHWLARLDGFTALGREVDKGDKWVQMADDGGIGVRASSRETGRKSSDRPRLTTRDCGPGEQGD
jgi:hypothetical protein